MNSLQTIAILCTLGITSTHAATLYELNESTPSGGTLSFSHTGDGNGNVTSFTTPDGQINTSDTSGNFALNGGTFSWSNLSGEMNNNIARFRGSFFFASEWSGGGTYTSEVIDISNQTDISFSYNGGSTFNDRDEFFNFFYILDGQKILAAELSENDALPEVMNTINIPMGNSLQVGWEYLLTGEDTSATVRELLVEGEAVPEPSTTLLGTLALLALSRRKR